MEKLLKIKVFAVLKDYFLEEFELSSNAQSLEQLKAELGKLNPSSNAILESCRFAVNNTFVDNSYSFARQDTIFIIPPSSGG